MSTAGQLKLVIGSPQAKKRWLEPVDWTIPQPPREPRSAGKERTKPQSQQGSGCGGKMDHSQTMAEWEPQQCVNWQINGVPAAVSWALGAWRSSILSCGRLEQYRM